MLFQFFKYVLAGCQKALQKFRVLKKVKNFVFILLKTIQHVDQLYVY